MIKVSDEQNNGPIDSYAQGGFDGSRTQQNFGKTNILGNAQNQKNNFVVNPDVISDTHSAGKIRRIDGAKTIDPEEEKAS